MQQPFDTLVPDAATQLQTANPADWPVAAGWWSGGGASRYAW